MVLLKVHRGNLDSPGWRDTYVFARLGVLVAKARPVRGKNVGAKNQIVGGTGGGEAGFDVFDHPAVVWFAVSTTHQAIGDVVILQAAAKGVLREEGAAGLIVIVRVCPSIVRVPALHDVEISSMIVGVEQLVGLVIQVNLQKVNVETEELRLHG
jgi:hypothetical protein